MHEDTSYSWRGKDGYRVRITVEPSDTYSNVCLFSVEPPLYPGGAIFTTPDRNTGHSPLARRIFELGGVSELLIAHACVTVTTAEAPDWAEVGARVCAAIREQIDSGVPSVSPEYKKTLPSSQAIRQKVQELIDRAVTPAVASHGGRVVLLDVKGNNVYLEFGGGCQGCGMAHVTLKYGVERMIRAHVPDVGQILDTTDHAGGTNPYYAPQTR